jgi:hypothetical protein
MEPYLQMMMQVRAWVLAILVAAVLCCAVVLLQQCSIACHQALEAHSCHPHVQTGTKTVTLNQRLLAVGPSANVVRWCQPGG